MGNGEATKWLRELLDMGTVLAADRDRREFYSALGSRLMYDERLADDVETAIAASEERARQREAG